jgi:hypothetical protein
MRVTILSVLLILSVIVKGQENAGEEEKSGSAFIPVLAVKHIKGLMSIDGYFKVTNFTVGSRLNFSHYIKRDWYLSYGAEFENGSIGLTDYLSFGANTLSGYSVWNYDNMVYLNLLGSAHLGYELLSIEENSKVEQGLLYEAGIGAEAEFFIIPKLCLSAIFNQRLYSNSKLGNFYYMGEFGIKYIF